MEELIETTLTVNGLPHKLKVKGHWSLLRILREQLGITSVREGCSEGECGACTVLLNGQPVPSCLILAGSLEKAEITTLEGISQKDNLHPLQEAFHQFGAVQCGFCTPGLILSAKALLDQNPKPSRQEIRMALSGNLCRCTGYLKPVEAIYEASRGRTAPKGEEKE